MGTSKSRSSIIISLDGMESFRNEWTEIYEKNFVKPHYLSFEFVKLWFQCFALPDQIRIFRIVSDGITIGFLPLVIKKEGFSSVLKSLTNSHCMHSGPLVRDGYICIFTELIYSEIIAKDCSWDLFSFDYVYSFDRYSSLFCADILDNIGRQWQMALEPTFVTSLNSDYTPYIGSLSKKWRRTIKNSTNRLANAGQSRFVCCQGGEAILLWSEFLKLEDSGWKGENGSSLARLGSNYQDYYRGLIDILAKNGTLRLFFLELNGVAIAGGVGYIDNDIFHYWKAGFDVQHQKLSPSNQLFLFVVRYIKENCSEVTKIHSFTGDFGYKDRFSNEVAVSKKIIIYNNTILGRLSGFLNRIKKVIKNNNIGYEIIIAIKKLKGFKG